MNIVAEHADLEREALQAATEIMGKSPQAQRMLKFALNCQPTDDGLMGQQVFAGGDASGLHDRRSHRGAGPVPREARSRLVTFPWYF